MSRRSLRGLTLSMKENGHDEIVLTGDGQLSAQGMDLVYLFRTLLLERRM